MEIEVTDSAQKWFKDEFDVSGQKGIRLFAKYGGSNSTLHPGFSIGVEADEPIEAVVLNNKDGSVFVFIEDHDYWYFKDRNWKIDYNPTTEEANYSFN
ncbi:HesB/YadR/YfhF family protein [Listeria sp. PSOL-1]|uniref:HesB/YadR/YfhF family protein n=1 Tax=Listeria sp. PSOL-1 TaxID=1844999 RepID=UPI0013CFAA2C|nr:HesB/YadR/YfhF family protein [Listeria sp. PSOL-1]